MQTCYIWMSPSTNAWGTSALHPKFSFWVHRPPFTQSESEKSFDLSISQGEKSRLWVKTLSRKDFTFWIIAKHWATTLRIWIRSYLWKTKCLLWPRWQYRCQLRCQPKLGHVLCEGIHSWARATAWAKAAQNTICLSLCFLPRFRSSLT